jgi:hypothetical protein
MRRVRKAVIATERAQREKYSKSAYFRSFPLIAACKVADKLDFRERYTLEPACGIVRRI